jgi:polysaccharide export outer membrane protein
MGANGGFRFSDDVSVMRRSLAAALFLVSLQGSTHAQDRPTSYAPVVPPHTVVPKGFVIGPEDVLSVHFWRDQEMSGEATVRPDGMITLPLVGDIRAAGLTPELLKVQIEQAASRLLTEPSVTVAVKEINSRQVFITGEVGKPGPYPLGGPRTVMQLIAMSGGLLEYADKDNIVVLRTVDGQQKSYKFRYSDVSRGKGLEQNIELQPGDTVVVP